VRKPNDFLSPAIEKMDRETFTDLLYFQKHTPGVLAGSYPWQETHAFFVSPGDGYTYHITITPPEATLKKFRFDKTKILVKSIRVTYETTLTANPVKVETIFPSEPAEGRQIEIYDLHGNKLESQCQYGLPIRG
jgi:hypothetical protein